jgi:uncharacterized protein (DUF58 family)
MSLRDTLKQAKAPQPPPLPGARARKAPPPLPTMPMPGERLGILRPQELDPLKNLLLFAQSIVEGWFAGKHRSLDFGSNAEFAEHKAYIAGDPVGQVDWKVYARSRKLVVKKYREERDMIGYLIVDMSKSMAYSVRGRDSKFLRAARIAASLSYLMQRQGDKSALALFNEKLVRSVLAGGTRRHLFDLIGALEDACQAPLGKTAAHGALGDCVPLFKKRGSVIVISDFFTDLDAFFDAIGQFLHRRMKVLLLHVMDPDEYGLPQVPLARFQDMETGESVQVAPDEIREAYQREMDEMIERLRTESQRRGIEYQILRTESPYIEAIEAWLGLRGNRNRTAAAEDGS